MKSIDIGNRLELFVDRYMVGTLKGVSFKLHEPQCQPLPKMPLPIEYSTVIKEDALYRAYYRSHRPDYKGKMEDGNPGEITCYATSCDGHEWKFPSLGVCKVRSKWGGNVLLANQDTCSHNFSPFRDTRPSVPKDARYKAFGGVHPGGGIYAFKSADGIHWKKMQDKPVITSEDFAFDSQNLAFWSKPEGCYVCFIRTWETPHGNLRTVSKATSKDFLTWSKPVPMKPNLKGEHIYTSQTHPYFRAPHIYISLPTRFVPDRGESTDIMFMATRASSNRFERLFTEAFIRPGLDPARWGNRSNYVALNVVPTGPAEMSIYHSSGYRYTLRTDGFVSIHAGTKQGELVTKPLIFSGKKLAVNCSTTAAGRLQVEILDADGRSIQGFGLNDCPIIVGDEIRHIVKWNGNPNLGKLSGKEVRLRFVMQECDLYSFQFQGK